MTRTLEQRQILDAAGKIKREENREKRKARKQAAAAHIRAIVATKAPGQRQPREKDNIYLAWVRRLPCIACVIEGGHCGPTEAAHLRFSDAARGRINSGMQAKPSDRWVTPLGTGHHQHDQHKRSERAFWDRLGIDAGRLCEDLYAAFLAGQDGLVVLARHASITDRRQEPRDDHNSIQPAARTARSET